MYARRAAASQEPAAPRETINLYTLSNPLVMTVCGVQYLNVADVDRVSGGRGGGMGEVGKWNHLKILVDECGKRWMKIMGWLNNRIDDIELCE